MAGPRIKKWPGQAGYQALQSLKLKMPNLLERLGLGHVVLIEKYLKPQLDAHMVKFFQHEGKVTDERIVPDNDARLKALDMTFKLGGAYAPTDPKPEYPMGVKVIMVDIPRPGDPEDYSTPQLPYPETRS